jgi:hypothetical protein
MKQTSLLISLDFYALVRKLQSFLGCPFFTQAIETVAQPTLE